MKQLLLIFLAVLFLVSFSNAQDWAFESVLYDHGLPVSDGYGTHGIAVDPNGNIWFAMYNYPTDSLVLADTTIVRYGPRVVDPSGNELAISPVDILTGAVAETLYSSCRGMAADIDGNIILSVAGKVYRINYQTGEGMNMYDFPAFTGSLTKPAVAANGDIYVGTVGPGNPVKILNPDFTEKGNAIDALSGAYNRAVAVTPDGMDLYFGSTWNGIGIRHFHSDIPGLLQYTIVDTIGNFQINDTTVQNLWPEDVTLSPSGDKIYAANTQTEWSDSTHGSLWWVFDRATGDELYSLGIQKGDSLAGGIWNGRGAAWSPDGSKMYMADFGYNNVTVWVPVTNIVEKDNEIIAETFKLEQNYPNPFNPTTRIPFILHKAAHVNLKIFNTSGQLVSTLIDEKMNKGRYEQTFDGSQLASGVYFYRLVVEGELLSGRMILVK